MKYINEWNIFFKKSDNKETIEELSEYLQEFFDKHGIKQGKNNKLFWDIRTRSTNSKLSLPPSQWMIYIRIPTLIDMEAPPTTIIEEDGMIKFSNCRRELFSMQHHLESRLDKKITIEGNREECEYDNADTGFYIISWVLKIYLK